MTVFHRSTDGLSNLHLFHRVDAVVFVEGAVHLSLEDLEKGLGDESTDDAAFWAQAFGLNARNLRVRVRSIGSKPNLLAIAHLVRSGSARRVIVAMDRDFDDRRNLKIGHPNVLYTHGYSWENDVFQTQSLEILIRDLLPNASGNSFFQQDIAAAATTLRQSFSTVVRLDHALATSGNLLTDREALLSCIQIRTPHPPIIDRSGVAAVLLSKRTEARCAPRGTADVDKDLHGHTLARWWRAQLSHLLGRAQGMKLPSSLISRLAISAYFRSASGEIQSHYRVLVNNVTS